MDIAGPEAAEQADETDINQPQASKALSCDGEMIESDALKAQICDENAHLPERPGSFAQAYQSFAPSLAEDCKDLFEELIRILIQLERTKRTARSLSIITGIRYCLENHLGEIIMQALELLHEVPTSSSTAQHHFDVIKGLFAECRSISSQCQSVIGDVDAASGWRCDQERALCNSWEDFALRLSRVLKALPVRIDLDMNQLLGRFDASVSFNM
jgi:hypothetical protein